MNTGLRIFMVVSNGTACVVCVRAVNTGQCVVCVRAMNTGQGVVCVRAVNTGRCVVCVRAVNNLAVSSGTACVVHVSQSCEHKNRTS